MISYIWKDNGTWRYAANEENEVLDIAVPMPSGEAVPIKHLSVNTACKMLGVFTCPMGNAKEKINSMQTKAQN